MSEIKKEWENVPIEEAKEMYDKGMTKSAIARILGFSEYSIRYSFDKNGFKTKRRNNPFTDNKVIELYKQGHSMESIAKKYEVSRTRIRTALNLNNIEIRQRECFDINNKIDDVDYSNYQLRDRKTNYTTSHSKYAYCSKIYTDETFFNEWSHELAYFLGWMASDGNISESKNTFRITSTDIEHLENMFSLFSYGWKTTVRKWNKKSQSEYKPAGTISIARKDIMDKLIDYGIPPNKSLILKMPYIPTQYMRDFVRGVFEGDGCITYKKNLSPKIVFASGSNDFLYGLGEAIEKQTGLKVHVYVDKKNTYSLSYDSPKAIDILFKYMYKGIPQVLVLDRKYNKFIEYYELKGGGKSDIDKHSREKSISTDNKA